MSQFSRAVSVASPGRRASMRTARPVRPVTSTSLRRHGHTTQHTLQPRDMSDTEAVSVARLISLVKERPVLWDRQEEVYKNRKLTRQAWAEICEALIDNYHDLGEHERLAIGRSIIGKWANLRDNWLRYWRKRQELLRVGSSTKTLKKYIHHDQLLFLSKVYDPEGQQEVEEIQVEVDVISDPEFESTVEFDETSQSSWNAAQYPQLSAPPLPQDQSERHLYFFHSIMPMICDFDDDQMLEFHAGVLEWIKRVKRRELINLQSSHSFCHQGVQESNVETGGFLRIKSEAATQSDCFCNSPRQIQVKKEQKRGFSYTTSNYVIPESTSTSNIPEGVSDLAENEVKQTISCDKSEFVSLKNVINKLEEISGTLEAQKVVSKQDLFEHNFGSLLTKLAPKKIQSLKRKIVKEVVREGFKKMKVESTSRCIKTEKSDGSLDSSPDSPNTLDVSERKIGGAIGLYSSDEKEAKPSILRDTLQNLPFILK